MAKMMIGMGNGILQLPLENAEGNNMVFPFWPVVLLRRFCRLLVGLRFDSERYYQ